MDMDPNDDDDDYEDSGDVLKTLFSLTPLVSQTYVHTTVRSMVAPSRTLIR